MPFISPVLWLDWITISALLTKRALGFDAVALTIAFCLYVICFWLTVGYGQLGYGLLQYNLLYIPEVCVAADFNIPTDPRRAHFVALHAVTFAFCSGAVLVGIMASCDGPHSAPFLKNRSRTQFVQTMVAGVLILPAFIGVIMAAVLNSHNYLILEQQGCFASFSSGRWGYLDQELTSWEIKIATWIGLNN